MNQEGSFIATLLDSSRRAYAAGTVLRIQETGPEGAALVQEWGFNDLVADLQLRIEHLAEALACGRPELFAVDVDWLAATYAAREISLALLETTLRCLRAELEEELPEAAGATAGGYVGRAIEGIERAATVPETLLAGERPHVELARGFLAAVLEGDRNGAEKVIFDANDAGVGIPDLHADVIVRTQLEVGRMWQAGEVDVAEEHFGSRIVEDVLVLLRARMPESDSAGRSVLVASVAGNLHDIGARIVADHFEMSGWRSIFLGANVPVPAVASALEDFAPDLVALSAGLGINVRAAANTIAALHASVSPLPVIVGGAPFVLVPDLWRDVGADGYAADARSAVEVGKQLLDARG